MSSTSATINKAGAFQSARRINRSLTAAVEKQALQWMAARAPRWLTSDQLTALGLSAQIAAGLCFALSRYNRYALLLAIVCIVLNWFGDSLDGTLARVRQQQRPRYGFYVDHVLDAIGFFFLLTGLAFSGYMSPSVAYGFLVAYLLLSIEIYLATYTVGTFHLSYWSFGPTELRILLVIGNLFALRNPHAVIAGREFLLFDLGFGIGTVALAIILVQAVVKHTVQLYREETKW